MEQLLKLLEYNFWANDLFITRAHANDPIPDSIQKQLSHLLTAHQIWLARVSGRDQMRSIWENVDISSWEGINIELYHESTDLIKSLSLGKIISYQNSRGNSYRNTLEEILYHLLHHSSHHRAQIALLMRQNDILPPQSDYIFYLREH